MACVLFSLLLWLLVSLTGLFSSQLPVSVQYTNLPPDRLITNTLPDHWSAKVRGPGWELISYKLFDRQLEVEVPLNELGNSELIDPGAYIPAIERQLDQALNIESLSPSLISIQTVLLDTIRLAVVASTDISLGSGLEMLHPLRLRPDSVTVYGHASSLAKLSSLRTASFQLKEQQVDTQFTLALHNPDSLKFRLSVPEVIAELSVGKAYRVHDTLDIEILGMPEGTEVKLLPARAQIEYTLLQGMDTDAIRDSFRLQISYEQLERSSNGFADIELSERPLAAREILIDPASVEFIIYKP